MLLSGRNRDYIGGISVTAHTPTARELHVTISIVGAWGLAFSQTIWQLTYAVTIKVLMIDVDGVVVVHPYLHGWSVNLERDLGLSRDTLAGRIFCATL